MSLSIPIFNGFVLQYYITLFYFIYLSKVIPVLHVIIYVIYEYLIT